MELKRAQVIHERVEAGSLNRTFMELKLRYGVIVPGLYIVLIAPLWN